MERKSHKEHLKKQLSR